MENKKNFFLRLLTKIKIPKKSNTFRTNLSAFLKQIFLYSTNLYFSCSERFEYLPRVFFVIFAFFVLDNS